MATYSPTVLLYNQCLPVTNVCHVLNPVANVVLITASYIEDPIHIVRHTQFLHMTVHVQLHTCSPQLACTRSSMKPQFN